jgi:predicted alpha/beta hydrolase
VSFRAADGQRLVGRLYEPDRPPRASVLALPGIGVPQRVFRHVGAYLAASGIRVLSVDYRGIGDSRDDRAMRTATLTRWAELDATAGLGHLLHLGASRPVLLAHSFGGQSLGIADALHDVSAGVLVGSQLGHPKHWRGLGRAKVELLWRVLLPLTVRDGAMVPRWVIGEELPPGVAREWRRWGLAEDWLSTHVPGADARFARFDRPLLAYGISDDDIAPPPAVDDLLRRLVAAPIRRVDVTPSELGRARIGHVGLFRPDGTEPIWREWLRFAVEHGAPDVDPREAEGRASLQPSEPGRSSQTGRATTPISSRIVRTAGV